MLSPRGYILGDSQHRALAGVDVANRRLKELPVVALPVRVLLHISREARALPGLSQAERWVSPRAGTRIQRPD